MLAKLTANNQLTLPRRAIDAVGNPPYFQVEVENDRLVLTPARPGAAASVRRKLAALGIKEQDIVEAVAWARKEAGQG